MQLYWGSVPFDVNSVWIGWSEMLVKNEADQPMTRHIAMTVRGYLAGADQYAVSALIIAMRLALQTPYRDLVLKHDDGRNSAHLLTNADSISGVTVTKGPDFSESFGTEFFNQRMFTFSAEADYYAPGTQALLVSFFESVTVSGGDPLYVCREALNTGPQRQLVYPSTTCTVIQQGRAIGLRGYPSPPPPLFPEVLKGGRDGNQIKQGSPDRRGNSYVNFPVEWSYIHESPIKLVAFPNKWV